MLAIGVRRRQPLGAQGVELRNSAVRVRAQWQAAALPRLVYVTSGGVFWIVAVGA